jgi:hypothetical protein
MKKNAKEKAPQKGKKPFFAKLLEEQELEQAAGGRRPIQGPQTRKFPSDADECDKEPVFVTLKYPSDNEDSGTIY